MRTHGVAVPQNARKLAIPSGKCECEHPSVATIYRLLAEADNADGRVGGRSGLQDHLIAPLTRISGPRLGIYAYYDCPPLYRGRCDRRRRVRFDGRCGLGVGLHSACDRVEWWVFVHGYRFRFRGAGAKRIRWSGCWQRVCYQSAEGCCGEG